MKRVFVLIAVLALLFTGIAAQATTIDWVGTGYGETDRCTELTSWFFDPNGLGTTIAGSLDLTNIPNNGVVMFGLVDKKFYEEGTSLISPISHVYQSGAYIYVHKTADNAAKIGTSDGNKGGGEVVTNATVVSLAENIVPFTLEIHDGDIILSSTLLTSALTSKYGVTKTRPDYANAYEWSEFQYGAYLGVSFNGTSEQSYGYNVTATNASPVPEPGTIVAALGLLGPAAMMFRRKRA